MRAPTAPNPRRVAPGGGAAPGPAYIIGLEAHYRGAALERQLAQHGVAFGHYRGVDGRDWSPEEVERRADQRAAQVLLHRRLTGGEIGCAASHRGLLAYLHAQTSSAWPVVLEDDARLEPSFAHLAAALGALPVEHPAVLVLYSHRDYTVLRARDLQVVRADLVVGRSATPPIFTTGYVVNRAALALIAGRAEHAIDYVADWPPQWSYDVEFYVAYPWMVRAGPDGASTLAVGRRALGPGGESPATRALRRVSAVSGLRFVRHRALYPSLRGYLRHEVVGPLRRREARLVGRRLWGRLDAPFVL